MVDSTSQVAQLRQQIAAEYMAAKWGLEGLRYGTGQHPFISRRMEEERQQLNALVGEEAGIPLFAETLAHSPEQPTRYHLQEVLRNELGNTEETEILLDHIQETWETIDLLVARFGMETMQKILHALPLSTDREPSSTPS
jgi:hypothetical protein